MQVRRPCQGPLCAGKPDPVPLIEEGLCRACTVKNREGMIASLAVRLEGGQPYVVAKVRQAIRLQAEGHTLMREALRLLDEALRAIQ